MTIRAILIDDEENNLLNLGNLLQQYCPEVEVVATARNASEGRSAILDNNPDVVFLDIHMPEQSGFDLLRSLPGYDFALIIVTAYDQYGIQAVKFSAIDYLLKPINITELQQAVSKVLLSKKKQEEKGKIDNLLHYIREQKEEHRIALHTVKETRFVNVSSIIRCESSNSYTTVSLDSKEKILVSRPLAEFEELLRDYGFIRCHQSHLVNIKQVKSWIRQDGSFLLTTDGAEVPVARNKKEWVQASLKIK